MTKFLQIEKYNGACPHCGTELQSVWKCMATVEKFSCTVYFCISCSRAIKVEKNVETALQNK
ncbi:MAG: hypothetical protein K8H86_14865 [Ignavibacteriaceae bacterium]|nr:hypothetical protein [Ignavibacteriaceae bacterium]